LKQRLARAVCLACLIGAGPEKLVWSAPRAANVALGVSPSSLDFGTLEIGSSSAPQPVMISNNGEKPTEVVALTSGIDFSQTNDCGDNLAAGAKCTVQVTFKPASEGNRVGTLNIIDSNPAVPHIVVLNGVGK
jgi:hypothetical protein